MANIDDLRDFEAGELSEGAEVRMFQKLIDSGSVWNMPTIYRFRAMSLIFSGKCQLGLVSFQDKFGNNIPSRYDENPELPHRN